MSENAPLIVSISGIRGIAGQSLTDQVVAQFASAFACFLPERATVVLARDTRVGEKVCFGSRSGVKSSRVYGTRCRCMSYANGQAHGL